MFIAVNAKQTTFSVRNSGRAGCDLAARSDPLLRTEKEIFCCPNYKHLAPTGRRRKAPLALTARSGFRATNKPMRPEGPLI